MNLELVCLPLIKERFMNFLHDIGHLDDNGHSISCNGFRCNVFPQVWGSTTLGFGGIDGSAMTEAYTVVCNITGTDIYGVFFGERLAYVIEYPNKLFFEDIKCHCLVCQDDVERYDSDDTSIEVVKYK